MSSACSAININVNINIRIRTTVIVTVFDVTKNGVFVVFVVFVISAPSRIGLVLITRAYEYS